MNTVLEKPVKQGLDKPIQEKEKGLDVNRENWPSYTVPIKHHRKPLSPKQLEILKLTRLYRKARSYNVKSYIYAEILRISDPFSYDLLDD